MRDEMRRMRRSFWFGLLGMAVLAVFAAAFAPVAGAGGGELDKEGFITERNLLTYYIANLPFRVQTESGQVRAYVVSLPRAVITLWTCCTKVRISPAVIFPSRPGPTIDGANLTWEIMETPLAFLDVRARDEQGVEHRIPIPEVRVEAYFQGESLEAQTAVSEIVRLTVEGRDGMDLLLLPTSAGFEYGGNTGTVGEIKALILGVQVIAVTPRPRISPPTPPSTDGRG